MFLDSSHIRGRFLHTSNKIAQFNFILFLFLLHMSFRLPVNNKLLFIIRTLQLLLSITSFRKHSLKWVVWQVSVNHITLNDTDLSKCKTTFKLFKLICFFFYKRTELYLPSECICIKQNMLLLLQLILPYKLYRVL